MALSIKTAEAVGPVRRLARLTGETMTGAVTIAVRERLSREAAHRAAVKNRPARVAAAAATIPGAYDPRPVGKAEWDEASGNHCCA